MKTKFQILTMILTGALLTGCGTGLDFVNERGEVLGAGLTEEPGCHSSPNILPLSDSTNDGYRRYSTCFDSSAPSQVRVYGSSSISDWVCAYPIKLVGVSSFVPTKDASGIPVSQCWNARALDGASQTLNFYFTGFDGLIVVDYNQRLDMSRCLMNGQTCPTDYSIGGL